MQNYSASVNLYGYYNKDIFFTQFCMDNMDGFWAWLVKMWYFFYIQVVIYFIFWETYTSSNMSTLNYSLLLLLFNVQFR